MKSSIAVVTILIASAVANAKLNPQEHISCFSIDEKSHISAITIEDGHTIIDAKTYRTSPVLENDGTFMYPNFLSMRSPFPTNVIHISPEPKSVEVRETGTFEVYEAQVETKSLKESKLSPATCFQLVKPN